MAPQDIFRKLKAVPYQPIRIYVSGGASYDVIEPTHAYVWVTELMIGLEPAQVGMPTHSVYVAPNHVTKIEPIASMPQSR